MQAKKAQNTQHSQTPGSNCGASIVFGSFTFKVVGVDDTALVIRKLTQHLRELAKKHVFLNPQNIGHDPAQSIQKSAFENQFSVTLREHIFTIAPLSGEDAAKQALLIKPVIVAQSEKPQGQNDSTPQSVLAQSSPRHSLDDIHDGTFDRLLKLTDVHLSAPENIRNHTTMAMLKEAMVQPKDPSALPKKALDTFYKTYFEDDASNKESHDKSGAEQHSDSFDDLIQNENHSIQRASTPKPIEDEHTLLLLDNDNRVDADAPLVLLSKVSNKVARQHEQGQDNAAHDTNEPQTKQPTFTHPPDSLGFFIQALEAIEIHEVLEVAAARRACLGNIYTFTSKDLTQDITQAELDFPADELKQSFAFLVHSGSFRQTSQDRYTLSPSSDVMLQMQYITGEDS